MNASEMSPDRIYLDNAATTWPKPEAVYDAVDHYQREIGAPTAAAAIAKRRNRIASSSGPGGASPTDRRRTILSHIIFGLNCSDMLNLAIAALCGRATTW